MAAIGAYVLFLVTMILVSGAVAGRLLKRR